MQHKFKKRQQAKVLNDFAEQPPPDRYAVLLRRVADAAQLAQQWQAACRQQMRDDTESDEPSGELFPASDLLIHATGLDVPSLLK